MSTAIKTHLHRILFVWLSVGVGIGKYGVLRGRGRAKGPCRERPEATAGSAGKLRSRNPLLRHADRCIEHLVPGVATRHVLGPRKPQEKKGKEPAAETPKT